MSGFLRRSGRFSTLVGLRLPSTLVGLRQRAAQHARYRRFHHEISRAVLLGLIFCSATHASAAEGDGASPGAPKALRAIVSIPPSAYFVQRVAGAEAVVTALVPPGQSPHTYEVTPRQMSALAEAQVYFRSGIGFEDALIPKIKASFPALRIVDLNQGITLRKTEHVCNHEHEHDHDHGPGAPDPHTWLDPRNAIRQVGVIYTTLRELPGSAADAELATRTARFTAELEELDTRLATRLAPFKGREFFVYHPAFGYFADRYGLRQTPAEIEGKEPTAKHLSALIERAKKHNVRVIFVQPQFNTRTADKLAGAINGSVAPIDDLAYDYPKNLEAIAAAIAKGLAE